MTAPDPRLYEIQARLSASGLPDDVRAWDTEYGDYVIWGTLRRSSPLRRTGPIMSTESDTILETLDASGIPKEFQFDAVVAVQKLLQPWQVGTVEELDALPDDSLVLASGKQLDGEFTDCWIRPVPLHISGSSGRRVWEVLTYGEHGYHNMTTADQVQFPATVLHVGGAE